MNLPELIEIARRNVRPNGAEYIWVMSPGLREIAETFDALALTPADWRGWIYHVPVSKDASKIQYRDVKMDHADYDYDRIVAHAVARGRALLVNEALYPFNPLQPMYERCRAMCAYVHSAAFNSPTVFLDGDAFVNADLTPIFKTIKDVAVTYRNDPWLMPINEGVIFAQPTEGTKAFFRSYLATYEHLSTLKEVVEFYGDIKRWRGGQLSLNALTCPEGVPSEMDVLETPGYRVNYLPCATWNFSMDMGQPYTSRELDTKAVLHLKGPRKLLVDQVIGYQNAQAGY